MSRPEADILRLGTRGSLLARTQSALVAESVRTLTGKQVQLVTIRAEGDDLSIPLSAPPRPGAFVATLRDALLAGRVDLVVHSFKDLPSEPLPGLVVAATPQRVDPRDALCSAAGQTLEGLAPGARVGTSSPRRAAELLLIRPDLEIVPIRGNVDTRLGKTVAGEVDAVLLAAAGLIRLGRQDAISEMLDPAVVLPAPAQGTLAVECREGSLATTLARLDHGPTRLAVSAERAVLSAIQAQCTTAIGALAQWEGTELLLRARLHQHRGVACADVTLSASAADVGQARELGAAVADRLLAG